MRGEERREQDRDARRIERIGGDRIAPRRPQLASDQQADADHEPDRHADRRREPSAIDRVAEEEHGGDDERHTGDPREELHTDQPFPVDRGPRCRRRAGRWARRRCRSLRRPWRRRWRRSHALRRWCDRGFLVEGHTRRGNDRRWRHDRRRCRTRWRDRVRWRRHHRPGHDWIARWLRRRASGRRRHRYRRSLACFQRRDTRCETLERHTSLVLAPLELPDVIPGADREHERSQCDEPPHQRSTPWQPASRTRASVALMARVGAPSKVA